MIVLIVDDREEDVLVPILLQHLLGIHPHPSLVVHLREVGLGDEEVVWNDLVFGVVEGEDA